MPLANSLTLDRAEYSSAFDTSRRPCSRLSIHPRCGAESFHRPSADSAAYLQLGLNPTALVAEADQHIRQDLLDSGCCGSNFLEHLQSPLQTKYSRQDSHSAVIDHGRKKQHKRGLSIGTTCEPRFVLADHRYCQR